MSILKKPYEVSVWEDVWDSSSNSFVEERIGIIGSNTMTGQGRVLEPKLTKNVNGSKKFSFNMYHRYYDSVTGEKVINGFSDLLTNERKVKLWYNGEWFDFLVKSVNITSTNYLYKYELVDAFVNELSKNGFNVILDTQLENNLDTVKGLAEKVLAGTDWNVDSDTFIEEIEEALVYVNINIEQLTNATVYKVQKAIDNQTGKEVLNEEPVTNLSGSLKALAFYSCCKNKPIRFQFLYNKDSNNENVFTVNDSRIIQEDCSYYIDIIDQNDYHEEGPFYLPKGFSLVSSEKQQQSNTDVSAFFSVMGQVTIKNISTKDSIYVTYTDSGDISTYCRANRYAFGQKTSFIPKLNKYVKYYTKINETGTGTDSYVGYTENEIIAPNLITNLISNAKFNGTSGWTGTVLSTNSQSVTIDANMKTSIVKTKAAIETVQGHWLYGSFTNLVDELLQNAYNSDNNYKSYLKVTFKKLDESDNSINGSQNTLNWQSALVNSGFYDNRKIIKSLSKKDEFVIRLKVLDKEGQAISPSQFKFYLEDCSFDTSLGWYNSTTGLTALALQWNIEDEGFYYAKFKYSGEEYNEKSFANKKFRIFMTYLDRKSLTEDYTIYIENFEIFRYYDFNGKPYMPLDAQNTEAKTITKYYYIKEEDLNSTNDVKELMNSPVNVQDMSYLPVFYENAESHRMVSAKESNYFNILQSIAETFYAWVDIIIERNDDGTPLSKTIRFKKYIGNESHSGFKYGVNLNSITRQDNSNNLTTKLIVKNNSNEYADGGFCTIQRANENITKETALYNFDYYIHQGLLSQEDYIEYTENKAFSNQQIADIDSGNKNYKGYYGYLGALNNKIIEKNNKLIEHQTAMIQLKSDITVAEATIKAAKEESEKEQEEFYQLTNRVWNDLEPITTTDKVLIDFKTNGTLDTNDCNTDDSSSKSMYFYKDDINITSDCITFCLTPYKEGLSSQEIDVASQWYAILAPDETTAANLNPSFNKLNGDPSWNNDYKETRIQTDSTMGGYFIDSTWQGIYSDWKKYGFQYSLIPENVPKRYSIKIRLTNSDNPICKYINNYLSSWYNDRIEVDININISLSGNGLYCYVILSFSGTRTKEFDLLLSTGFWLPDNSGIYHECNANSTIMRANSQIDGINGSKIYSHSGDSFSPFRVPQSWINEYVLEEKIKTLSGFDKDIYSIKVDNTDRKPFDDAEQWLNQKDNSTTYFNFETKISPTTEYYNNVNHKVKCYIPLKISLKSWRGSPCNCECTWYASGTLENIFPLKYKIIFEWVETGNESLTLIEYDSHPANFTIYGVRNNEPNPPGEVLYTGSFGGTDLEQPGLTTKKVSIDSTDQQQITTITFDSLPLQKTLGELKDYEYLLLQTNSKQFIRFPLDTSNHNIYTSLLTITEQNSIQQENEILLGSYDEELQKGSGLLLEQHELQTQINLINKDIDSLKKEKERINKEFYSKYYRFIQEGTWIDESYIDDEKYYIDAQSTLYNSCYPQVSYNINVLELSQLPGYEYFTFGLGDTTFVEDPEFFGENNRVEIAITETVNNLDAPNTDSIKVQNYKNQFQDLFQKITATTQQVQYSTGAYDKAGSLANGNENQVKQLVTGSVGNVADLIKDAGRQSVDWESGNGIIITDLDKPSEQLRLTGGAILFGTQNEKTGEQQWFTGLTPKGISASLIRAGRLDVDNIQIMASSQPTFRWDAFGLTAYNYGTINGDIAGIDFTKFVRFDRWGLYGAEFGDDGKTINGKTIYDGAQWHPMSADEAEKNATFSLTWQGLKVTGNGGVTALIGKQGDNIINVAKTYKTTEDGKETTKTENLFTVNNNGNVALKGDISGSTGTFAGNLNVGNTNGYSWQFSSESGLYMWCGNNLTPENAVFKIWKNKNTQQEELSIKGHVEATSGAFGSCRVDGAKNYLNIEFENQNSSILLDSNSPYSYQLRGTIDPTTEEYAITLMNVYDRFIYNWYFKKELTDEDNNTAPAEDYDKDWFKNKIGTIRSRTVLSPFGTSILWAVYFNNPKDKKIGVSFQTSYWNLQPTIQIWGMIENEEGEKIVSYIFNKESF